MNETEQSSEEVWSRVSSADTSPVGREGSTRSDEAGNELVPPKFESRPRRINLGVEGSEGGPGSVSLPISKVDRGSRADCVFLQFTREQ